MADEPTSMNEDETKYFKAHPIIHFLVQFFLVIHTILSAIKGIIYGLSFIVFEEKKFCNFFRKCFFKKKDLINNDLESKEIMKDSYRKSDNTEKYLGDDVEDDKKDEENNGNENVEMNSQTE